MKKFVSLLLAVMMLASMMTFNVMASTDNLLSASTAENSLTEGPLDISKGAGNCFRATNYTNTGSDATVVTDGTNNIFEINGFSGSSTTGNVLYYLLATTGYFNVEMSRFSAKIKLPAVESGGVTKLFTPSNNWTATYSSNTFGVTLKNGGAYYYDEATAMDVAFIAENTMSANTWYTVEAIMDSREAKLDGDKTYMNAFVYDASGTLVGTSGWQYVSNDAPYDSHYAWLSTQISARGYAEESVVAVDEFNVYKITDVPTYTIANGEPKSNKYIATSTWTNTYRAVGEWYTTATNADNALISATSANKAVRFETSVRFLDLPTTQYNTFVLLKVASALPWKSNNTEVFDGTVQITKDGLVVKSYNSSTSKYDTAVTLSNGSTTYAINANEWYTLVWDIDFSSYASPVATLTVKDSTGSVLVSTPTAYAAAPLVTNSWNQSMILWASPTNSDKVLHLDNTKVYGAATAAGLDDAESRTTAIEDDYEVYDNNLYAVDATYSAIVGADGSEAHKAKAVSGLNAGIIVAEESIPAVAFVDGTVFENTNPVKLTFTYDNPVPVANINTSNIELYENGVKKVSGYTVTSGTQDENNCTTSVTVDVTELSYGAEYTLRLKAGLADYNEALSGGVPADSGLYKDYTFSVASLTPDCTIVGEIIEGTGTATGKVTFTNNEDSPITCYAILAVYQGNKLVDIEKSELITVASGAENYEVTVAAEEPVQLPEGATAKLFVWNNFETMIPWLIRPVVLGE